MQAKIGWIRVAIQDDGDIEPYDQSLYSEVQFEEPDSYELNLFIKVLVTPLEDFEL